MTDPDAEPDADPDPDALPLDDDDPLADADALLLAVLLAVVERVHDGLVDVVASEEPVTVGDAP